MFKQLPSIRILVCGAKAERHQVFAALDRLAQRREITTLIHSDEGEATGFADEWAALHDIDRIASPAAYRVRAAQLGTSRAIHIVQGLKAEGVIAFLGGTHRERIIEVAKTAGLEVWMPFG